MRESCVWHAPFSQLRAAPATSHEPRLHPACERRVHSLFARVSPITHAAKHLDQFWRGAAAEGRERYSNVKLIRQRSLLRCAGN